MKTTLVLVAVLVVCGMVQCVPSSPKASIVAAEGKLEGKRGTAHGNWPDVWIELLSFYAKCLASRNLFSLMGDVPFGDSLLVKVCPDIITIVEYMSPETLDFDTLVEASEQSSEYFRVYQCANLQGDRENVQLMSMANGSPDHSTFEAAGSIIFDKCMDDYLIHAGMKRAGSENMIVRDFAQSMKKFAEAVKRR